MKRMHTYRGLWMSSAGMRMVAMCERTAKCKTRITFTARRRPWSSKTAPFSKGLADSIAKLAVKVMIRQVWRRHVVILINLDKA